MTLEEAQKLISLESSLRKAISSEDARNQLDRACEEYDISKDVYDILKPPASYLSISEELDFNDLMNTAKETIRLARKEKINENREPATMGN